MARPIYDPDGHLKNYCIVSRALCEIFPNAVSSEIHQHSTPFELYQLLDKECLPGISLLTMDQTQALSCGQTEDLPLSTLCYVLKCLQTRQIREKHLNLTVKTVSPDDLNEIQTLLKELYVFENKRMIPKKEFRKLWKKVKYLCLQFDKHSLPKLISYYKQCKAIKKKYTYGREEDICSLMRKQWRDEGESFRKEVIKLRSLYQEYSARNVFQHVTISWKKMINFLRGRNTKIENPSDYWSEQTGLCVSTKQLDDELVNHHIGRHPIGLSYDVKPMERANLKYETRTSSLSDLDNQAVSEETPCLMTDGDNLDNDAPLQFNALLGEESSILEMDISDSRGQSTMVKYTEGQNIQEEAPSFHQNRVENLLRISPTNEYSKVRFTLESNLDTGKGPTDMKYQVKEGENLLCRRETERNTEQISDVKTECSISPNSGCKEKTNKFESKHEFRIETHCPGPPDKKLDENGCEKSGFSTYHSLVWPSQFFTHFVTRSTFDSHFTELGSSFLHSSAMSEASSYWRRTPSIHESDFADLGSKTDVTYVEKINSMLSYLQTSSEGMVSALCSGRSPESVLTLNCKLLSSSIVREDNNLETQNTLQLHSDIFKKYENHDKAQLVFFPSIRCIFHETVCGLSLYACFPKIPIKLCERSEIVLQEVRKGANEDFRRMVEFLIGRISFCYDVRNQKKYMIEYSTGSSLALNCLKTSDLSVQCTDISVENNVIELNSDVCAESMSIHSEGNKGDSFTSFHSQESMAELSIQTNMLPLRNKMAILENDTKPNNTDSLDSFEVEARRKYAMKKEKEKLKKRVVKRMYSALWAEKTSKKRFHQAVRRASIQCLMDKFFKNFNAIVKKDDNEVSKIINHYFNLLSFNVSLSSVPVGRDTPSRLEAFFQEIIENEDATAADTMHVEWMRLRTFWSYPTNTGVSTLQLARDGFYYTGHTTETRCFCCRNVYREWDETSNINEIHRRISPDCDIAFGRSTRNITIHDNQGGINLLRGSNPETLAPAQYQTRTQDEAAEPDLTSELSAEQTSNSEREQDDSAQISQGAEKQSAQSPKLSKSKIKRDKRKKKKELASSSQSAAGGFVVTDEPQTTQTTSSSSATGSQAIDTEAASNATTNATGGATAAARSIPEKAKDSLAVGGFQIEEVQHHSASLPFERSQQALSSIPTTSASIPPSISQSQTSQQSQSQVSRQGGGGANPPGPSQGGAAPPGPTSAERLAQLDPLGINFDKPKYPAYAVYSTRLSSFEGWPSHMAQTPREMARAGYFYAGYGDYARCFFCGGGLRNWDRTDEPWMEHARWFPRCAFLRNNKGDKYVARVQRRHQEQEAGLEPSSQLPPPIERDMETAIAESLREMGYTNEIIQRAMNKWRLNLRPGRRYPPPMTAAGILDIIEEIQGADENHTHTQSVIQERPLTIPGIQDLHIADGSQASTENSDGASALEENRTDFNPADGRPTEYGYDQREKQEKQILQEDFLGLTETIVCKVCCDKDVAAAFLPCGHLVCCLDCAPAMRKCPLCGELIKGTVKTYFA